MTVVIPTLEASEHLLECVRSLEKQCWKDFEIVVIDNSGQGRARRRIDAGGAGCPLRVIENPRNVGFGAAINQGVRESRAPFVAALNDDTLVSPGWIAAMVEALESNPAAGMCACQVRLYDDGRLDSAGMLISGDASSKQRGHLEPAARYARGGEALLPSGSAALYRRAMLDVVGLFEEEFFLYCEDTDLGLRARWAGWECVYAPGAVVEHRYSQSAGTASPLKAYYVERNRLFVLVRNFPARLLWRAPFVAVARYFWHAAYMLARRGTAARFREGSGGIALVWIVLRAHAAALARIATLWRARRRIRSSAVLSPAEFARLLHRHWISPRQVAQL